MLPAGDCRNPRLERQVHRFESGAGSALERTAQQPHQDAIEDFTLSETCRRAAARREAEVVLAIEQAREQEQAFPSELLAHRVLKHERAKLHRFGAGWMD